MNKYLSQAAVVAIVAAFGSEAAAQECTTKIGAVLSTSVDWGKPIAATAQYAVDLANEAGGGAGCEIEMVLRDTQVDPKVGVDAAKALVAHMLKPETQIATLKATNFFPVVDVALPDDLPPSVQAAGAAVATMSASPDANPGLLPAGLGDKGGEFNRVFVDAFERIVLAGQPIEAVLDDQKKALMRIMEETGAPCWAPDAPSEGACPVE